MFFMLLLTIWQTLEQWDQWLFIKINSSFTNSFFDSLMPVMRYPLNWAPLYLFLGVFAILNFKSKGAWWLLFFIITIALTDMTGTYVFKHSFQRVRPCGDPDFFFNVRLLADHCSTGYSFISNHAANHFGLATFFYITSRPLLKNYAAIAFIWAGLIGYSQVYIGIHYPSDTFGGALLGLLFGGLTGYVFNKRHGFAIFDKQSTVSS
ncbi:MAG: phosphatase PAP2 family protein [Chitinophagaceae bacterium]